MKRNLKTKISWENIFRQDAEHRVIVKIAETVKYVFDVDAPVLTDSWFEKKLLVKAICFGFLD